MAIGFAYDFDPSLGVIVFYGNATTCEARLMDKANFAEAAARAPIGGLTYALTPQSGTIVDKTPLGLFTNGVSPGYS